MGNCVAIRIGVYENDVDSPSLPRQWITRPTKEQAVETFKLEGTISSSKEHGHIDFRAILDYDISHQYLRKFAQSPYIATHFPQCEFRLAAWLAIRKWKLKQLAQGFIGKGNLRIATPDEKDTMYFDASHIYHKHFVEGKCRNSLPAQIDQELVSDLFERGRSDGHITVLDKAYSHLFLLLYEDLYMPFIRTPEFQEMKSKLRQKYNNVHPDDFEYLGVLGKGGFGIVVEVVKKSTNVRYAMKIQSKQVLYDSFGEEPWRACLEMQAFACCKHPFIVELCYAFQTSALVMLVMSSNNGRDLEQLLRYGGCFTHQQVVFYAAEITSALNYLHNKSFVFRDLKAGNVLVNADCHIQLIDFGAVCDLDGKTLAKCMIGESEAAPASLFSNKTGGGSNRASYVGSISDEDGGDGDGDDDIRANTFVGTYMYMAPEIVDVGTARGNDGYTKAVDFWSLGVLVYRLLTREYPFKSALQLLSPVNYEREQLQEERCPHVIDFISSLLKVDEKERLGYGETGSVDVLKHPYFESLDLSKLESKQLPPPPISIVDEPISASSTRKIANLQHLLHMNFKSDWLRVGKAFTAADSVVQSSFVSWEYTSRSAVKLEVENAEYWKDCGSYQQPVGGTRSWTASYTGAGASSLISAGTAAGAHGTHNSAGYSM